MARIVFEPSGTRLHKDKLKVRLDIFPEVGEKAYQEYYVYVPVIPKNATKEQLEDQAWLDALPHIWQLNPHLSLSVRIGTDITKQLLEEWLGDILTADVLATVDDIMAKPDSAHVISPYMRTRCNLSTTKVTSFDEQDKDDINQTLSGLAVTRNGGNPDVVGRGSIDIGSGAENRSTSETIYNKTSLSNENAANGTGTLDTVEIWLTAQGGILMGTFTGSGTSWANNDYEDIGIVSAGSKHTDSGVDIDVTSGDLIGCAVDIFLAAIEAGIDVAGKLLVDSQDNMGDPSSYEYSVVEREISLYGTGTEAGWSNIAKVGGVTATDLAKVDGIAVGNIVKVNGISV